MDSVSQAVLGGAVAYAVGGRVLGRKALVWGAALGTVPDLDVFVPMGDAVSSYTYHRSWSHSLFVLGLASPLFGWLGRRVHPATSDLRRTWCWLALLVFWTHVLLDSFTVYGTQIFWPFPRAPESWSTIFIIDPLYTAPLVAGCVAAWLLDARRPRRARRINAVLLGASTLYLAWTVGVKLHVDGVVEADLRARGTVAGARVMTTPLPLQTLLWRIVVMDPVSESYSEGFYSLAADRGQPIRWRSFDSGYELLDGVFRTTPSVERLAWFTHGFYSVRRRRDEASARDVLEIADLRMGAEPDYVFRFVVGAYDDDGDGEPHAVVPDGTRITPSLEVWPRVWARIWDRDVELR